MKEKAQGSGLKEKMKSLDLPVPGETGFAFYGAGRPGNDGLGVWIPRTSRRMTEEGAWRRARRAWSRAHRAEGMA